MPRPALLFSLSLAAALAVGIALESASRAQAEARVLIDKRGNIRFEGYGEFHLNDGTYRTWDGRIRELLAE